MSLVVGLFPSRNILVEGDPFVTEFLRGLRFFSLIREGIPPLSLFSSLSPSLTTVFVGEIPLHPVSYSLSS